MSLPLRFTCSGSYVFHSRIEEMINLTNCPVASQYIFYRCVYIHTYEYKRLQLVKLRSVDEGQWRGACLKGAQVKADESIYYIRVFTVEEELN